MAVQDFGIWQAIPRLCAAFSKKRLANCPRLVGLIETFAHSYKHGALPTADVAPFEALPGHRFLVGSPKARSTLLANFWVEPVDASPPTRQGFGICARQYMGFRKQTQP